MSKALENYTKALHAVKDHIEDNKNVFDAHQQLVGNLFDAESALRDEAFESKQNMNNGAVRVTYSPVYKKFYDGNFVMENVAPKVRAALIEAGAAQYEIDKDKFDELVEKGIVPIEIKQKAYREIEQKPRVAIKEIKE